MKLFLRIAPVAFALCAGFPLIPSGRAQSTTQMGEDRFLFIFDTSSEMKRRQTAVQTEMKQLLATSMGGQLHSGDSIGVWTFGQELNTAKFPEQRWLPADAVTIASDINKFVGKQRFTGNTRFSALQPRLNEIIQHSGRLTVLIFSDGGDDINWTPYDAGINQVFKQRQAEQKNTRQPFVLVFRTQLGQYTGCTMNFPPGMVSIPDFPPPPAPPAPANPPPAAPPTPTNPPPPAPEVKPPLGPPLIIIGTTVETNWPPVPPPKPAPVVSTNPAPVTPTNIVPVAPTNTVAPPPPTNPAPAIETNEVPAPPVNLIPPTNSAPAPPPKPVSVPPPSPAASTNAVAAPPDNAGSDHKAAIAIGAVLLIAGGGLVAFAAFRSRRSGSSLITRSMRKD